MIIGIDFDNTIVCYDGLFYLVAVEQGLIPSEVSTSKNEVRDYLRQHDREDEWTKLQGYVYGVRMNDANPFPGVLECFANLIKHNIEVYIISHRTRYPYLGPKYDLHRTAKQWIEQHDFFTSAQIGLPSERMFFELSKDDKLKRIKRVGCTHFIDDLPEFLTEPEFPERVECILFDPNRHHVGKYGFRCVASWKEIEDLLLSEWTR